MACKVWMHGLADEAGEYLTPYHAQKTKKICKQDNRTIGYYIWNRFLKAKDLCRWRLPTNMLEEIKEGKSPIDIAHEQGIEVNFFESAQFALLLFKIQKAIVTGNNLESWPFARFVKTNSE